MITQFLFFWSDYWDFHLTYCHWSWGAWKWLENIIVVCQIKLQDNICFMYNCTYKSTNTVKWNAFSVEWSRKALQIQWIYSGWTGSMELHFKHDKCRPFVYPTSTTVMGGVAHGTHLCLYLILHLYLYLCLDSYLTSVVFAATTTVTRGEEKPAALICFPPLTTFDATEN